MRHPEAAVVYSDIQERSGAVPLRGAIRREAILAAAPIPEGRKQETVWIVSLAREGELHRVPRTLYKRRIWPGSLSAKTRRVEQAQAYRVTVDWALGMLAAALPVVPPTDHDRLLATIIDCMVVPKTGRRFQFNPKRASDADRLKLVTEFLQEAVRRHGVVPLAKMTERSDAEALLRACKEPRVSPAEALMAEAVLNDLVLFRAARVAGESGLAV